MLTPLAWLLGFLLPACGMAGAAGVPAAPPNLSHLVRPKSPNTALAAPTGFRPAPDIATPVYRMNPDQLFALVRRIASQRPATYPLAEDPVLRRAGWVVRSLVLNFPDIVWAQVIPGPDGGSELVLYSRSLYGYGDFGVNRRRLADWLAAVRADAAVAGKG